MSDAIERARQAALALTPGEWIRVSREVDDEFRRRYLARREEEARALVSRMDMSPEGYVREWATRGRQNQRPLRAWEWAYQSAGIIEQAERLGYVEIGRAVSAPVTLTQAGEALLARPGERMSP